jgi:hypothetical protein
MEITNESVSPRLYPHANIYGRKIYSDSCTIYILTISPGKNILQIAEFLSAPT